MNLDFEEFIDDFVSETLEHLRQTESLLLSLESADEATAAEAVQGVFRCVHSVKGTAGFVGLHRINELAHATENVLDLIRGSQIDPDSAVIDALLKSIDQLRVMAENARDSSQIDVTELVQTLHAVSNRSNDSSGSNKETDPEDYALPPAVSKPEKTPAQATSPQDQTGARAANQCSSATVRVPVAALDRLTQLASELRSSQDRLQAAVVIRGDQHLAKLSTELDQRICELQQTMQQTTMQPIGGVFSRFTRVVRDLAVMLNKQCELIIEGADLTIQKSLGEAIVDPLSHLVRNALDHGLETKEARHHSGKSATGRIALAASRRNGKLCIEIQDDGGISVQNIKAKAVVKGVITEEQAKEMSDSQTLRLIFAPGFSTAAQVTNVSGRGVGMDVVLTNIERLGGAVEIETSEGNGTTIRLLLPQ